MGKFWQRISCKRSFHFSSFMHKMKHWVFIVCIIFHPLNYHDMNLQIGFYSFLPPIHSFLFWRFDNFSWLACLLYFLGLEFKVPVCLTVLVDQLLKLPRETTIHRQGGRMFYFLLLKAFFSVCYFWTNTSSRNTAWLNTSFALAFSTGSLIHLERLKFWS